MSLQSASLDHSARTGPRGAAARAGKGTIGVARVVLAVVGAMALAAAHAQSATGAGVNSELPLEAVVVTGTRIPESPDSLPSSVTVIDRAAIELQNKTSTVDLLRNVPGIQIVQPGGGAGVVSVYLRGCQPNYVLFLVDGVKVNDSNDSRGGSFDVSSVAPGEIERVEVIRGPESAVYGADAMCGVVNFITRQRGEQWQGTAALAGGLNSSYATSLAVEGPLQARGGVALRAGTTDQGAVVPGATYGADNFSAKVRLDQGEGWDLTLHGRYAKTHGTDYPAQSGGPDFALSNARDRRSTRQSGFDVQGQFQPTGFLTLNVLGSTYHHDVDFTSPAVLVPGGNIGIPGRGEMSSLARDYAAAHATLDLLPGVKAILGADYLRERGSVDGYIEIFPGFSLPDSYLLRRHDTGVFVEAQYAGGNGLTLNGSLRRDAPSGAQSDSTAKAGAVYTPDGGTTEVRLEWGQGFKLPSLWALGNALVGNSALLPERSRTTEFGLTRWLMARRLKAELSVFDNHFVNLIDFDNTLFKFVNRSMVTGRGADFSLSASPVQSLTLKGQASYVQLDVRDSGVALTQRPKWRGGLELNWAASEQWSLYAGWLATGKVYDFSIPVGNVMLGGYSRLDVNAQWRPTKSLQLQLAIDNLLDHHYYEAYGFAVAGIEPRLSVEYRF
ncbi:MAG: TonB-dependent receptor [Proteobacteria bacterium]|nr:TonB-dependent receptor [Pseudomonadota bacterium]